MKKGALSKLTWSGMITFSRSKTEVILIVIMYTENLISESSNLDEVDFHTEKKRLSFVKEEVR